MHLSKNDAEWQAKIDHRLRALIDRAKDRPEEANQIVNVLVRFSGSITALEAQNIRLRTLAGDIAIASIPLAEIPRIASLPEIVFIEMSQSLHPDSSSE